MKSIPLNSLPTIPSVIHVKHSDNQVVVELMINENLRCFQGHFDGSPVVAGVVQLDWAVLFAKQYLSFQGENIKISALKFQKLMLPKMKVNLKLIQQSETKFTFEYSNDDVIFSSAKIEIT